MQQPAAAPPPRFLRVRRRRNASTASMLQMEMHEGKKRSRGLSEQMQALAELQLTASGSTSSMVNGTIGASNHSHASSTASVASSSSRSNKRCRLTVWKKVENWNEAQQQFPAVASALESQESALGTRRKSIVIHAVLEEEDDDNDDNNNMGPSSPIRKKRRFLTLVDPKNASNHHRPRLSTAVRRRRSNNSAAAAAAATTHTHHHHHHGNAVLDPIQRLVNDSLRQVATGERTAARHYQYCLAQQDVLQQHSSTDGDDWWLAWTVPAVGNVLHACALQNDVATTAAILAVAADPFGLLQATNTPGQTPYQVAQQAGHAAVCQELDRVLASKEQQDGDEDDDYVFDVYCLDPSSSGGGVMNEDDNHAGMDHNGSQQEQQAPPVVGEGAPAPFVWNPPSNNTNATTNGESSKTGAPTEEEMMMTCELQGCVGYWDDRGELVLEIGDEIINNGDVDNGDDDSNSENWGGNDYPDDDDDDGAAVLIGSSSDSHDDDDDSVDGGGRSFRHDPVDWKQRQPPSSFASGLYGDDDEEYYSHDAAYGIYNGGGLQQDEEEYDREC